jgi:hypothetical protein
MTNNSNRQFVMFGAIDTTRIVIVGAGNGATLYTSQDMPLFFGGLGCSGGGGGG